jgi:hypothetical protein
MQVVMFTDTSMKVLDALARKAGLKVDTSNTKPLVASK